MDLRHEHPPRLADLPPPRRDVLAHGAREMHLARLGDGADGARDLAPRERAARAPVAQQVQCDLRVGVGQVHFDAGVVAAQGCGGVRHQSGEC